MNRLITKLMVAVAMIVFLCGCSKYNGKFDGYTKEAYLQTKESRALSVPKHFNVKPSSKEYNIPKISKEKEPLDASISDYPPILS